VEIESFLRPLVGHDFGAWSRDDIDGCLDGEAWRHRDDRGGQSLTASRAGWDWAANPRQQWHEHYWGDFISVSVSRRVPAEEADASYRPLLSAAIAVLGPPALVGGPGAFARWRRQDTTVVVQRTVHADTARVALSVVPTSASENDDYRRGNYDPDYAPEYRWRVRSEPGSAADKTLLGMYSFPRGFAVDWPTLRANLRALFGSLAGDIPVLHPYASGVVWVLSRQDEPEGFLAQGWFAPDESHLEIPPDTFDTRPPGREHGVALADLTADALEATVASPRQLRYNAFANVKPQILDDINGFGLPHVSEKHPDFRE
jgi:hypothetical protein